MRELEYYFPSMNIEIRHGLITVFITAPNRVPPIETDNEEKPEGICIHMYIYVYLEFP